MFTQCPECSVAFRVTADVLKQAAGKVRCGSCGAAFNALNHLSEEMPQAVSPPISQTSVPELSADADTELTADSAPKSISAEQSAALLKTLDQLAGEDIRIEDTGVEWRVLDDDGAEDDEPEIIDQRPTEAPVDEPAEELRFDDNTPLPDDYDAEPSIIPDPVIEPVKPPPYEEMQVDLALAETGDWGDLLDEVEPAPALSAGDLPPAIEEPVARDPSAHQPKVHETISHKPVVHEPVVHKSADDEPIASESSVDESQAEDPIAETPESDQDASDRTIIDELEALPDLEELEKTASAALDAESDAPLDIDTQFGLQAEAMGIDITASRAGIDAESDNEADEAVTDEPVDKLDRSIEEDLIAAAFESEEAEREAAAEIERAEQQEIDLDDVAPKDLSRAGILDEEDYLEPITAEDEAAAKAALETEESASDEDVDDDVPDSTMALETELEAAAAALEDQLEDEAEQRDAVAEAIDEAIGDGRDDADDYDVLADQADEDATTQEEFDLDGDITETPFDDAGENIDEDLAAALEQPKREDLIVPEQTEEELTINRMIDQELLAIAVEDDDGFTSTIVQKQLSDADDIPDDAANDDIDDFDQAANETVEIAAPKKNPMMETIIMEGATAVAAEDLEQFEADRKEAAENMDKTSSDADGAGSRNWNMPNWGMIAASVVLALILIVQVIHQSREALATNSMFETTVAPIYRSIGSPVTPDWDVAGWRFEATKGSTDENDEVLTIYSRIGNRSETELPYPLVHVSLTDRFEEVVGSRVMEPSEYLVDNNDPSRPIAPGSSFNAVIAIESVAEDATGFKLNVCYRMASGQLRCAIEDFK